MAETLLFNIGEYKIIEVTTTGPSSYVTGGSTVTVSSAKEIKAVLAAGNTGKYLVDRKELQDSVSDNTFKLIVNYFSYSATADGAAVEVAAGTDLSGATFSVLVLAV